MATAAVDVFAAVDGLRLAGWYVSSHNGAAVIVAPGRSTAVQRHARMLIRHGYGVLVFDRRGEGRSQGDANLYGWSVTRTCSERSRSCAANPACERGGSAAWACRSVARCLLQAAAETSA